MSWPDRLTLIGIFAAGMPVILRWVRWCDRRTGPANDA